MKIFDEELKLRNLVAKEYSKKIPKNVQKSMIFEPTLPNLKRSRDLILGTISL